MGRKKRTVARAPVGEYLQSAEKSPVYPCFREELREDPISKIRYDTDNKRETSRNNSAHDRSAAARRSPPITITPRACAINPPAVYRSIYCYCALLMSYLEYIWL
jgi:hypothetical protein